MIWKMYYNLACNFYNHNGHLNIPRLFRTKNGVDYDKTGKPIGNWIYYQRVAHEKGSLSMVKVLLLEKIGISWEYKKFTYTKNPWMENFRLVQIYFNKNGNTDMDIKFRTKNGIDYDPDGVALKVWLRNQTRADRFNNLSDEQKELLASVGITIIPCYLISWHKSYLLAKAYYDKHGNLNTPTDFKTKDGVNPDPDGYNLGDWVARQRHYYNKNLLTREQKKLLDAIGITKTSIEINWMKNYKLVLAYYKHYGNINIKQNFKTKNGYDYDPNGYPIGIWIRTQRQGYKGKIGTSLTPKKIKLLDKLGMVWSAFDSAWEDAFLLAKTYYNYYGDLDVPAAFRTNDEINPDPNGFT